MAAVSAAWACAWAGWLGRDWAYWATSSGALIVGQVVLIWRDLPRT